MKAIQITAKQTVIDIDVPEPDVIPAGHIKVNVKASCICNQHEIKIYNDLYQGIQKVKYPGAPGFPGHEGSGVVVAVGEGVTSHSVGDHVILTGHCGNLHTDVVVCRAELAPKVSRSLAFVDTAPSELFACGLQLCRRGDFINRRHVVINGIGPAGLVFIQWLKIFGATRITAVDLIESRLQKALDHGADDAVNGKDADAMRLLEKQKPDTVIECSGSHAGFRTAFQTAAQEVLIMGYNDQPFEVNQSEWFHRGLTIKQTFIFDNPTWQETARYVTRGLIQPGRTVTHVLPLCAGSYREAMALFRDPSVYKIVLAH